MIDVCLVGMAVVCCLVVGRFSSRIKIERACLLQRKREREIEREREKERKEKKMELYIVPRKPQKGTERGGPIFIFEAPRRRPLKTRGKSFENECSRPTRCCIWHFSWCMGCDHHVREAKSNNRLSRGQKCTQLVQTPIISSSFQGRRGKCVHPYLFCLVFIVIMIIYSTTRR
jgi:hypothetical protein